MHFTAQIFILFPPRTDLAFVCNNCIICFGWNFLISVHFITFHFDSYILFYSFKLFVQSYGLTRAHFLHIVTMCVTNKESSVFNLESFLIHGQA